MHKACLLHHTGGDMQFVRDGAGSGRKDEVRAGERDAQRGRALPPERMMMNAGHGCEQEPQCRGNRESSLRHKSGTKDVALQALKPRLRTPRRPGGISKRTKQKRSWDLAKAANQNIFILQRRERLCRILRKQRPGTPQPTWPRKVICRSRREQNSTAVFW